METTTTTKPVRPRTKYTKEFKQQAVALARRSDVGFRRAAGDLGLNEAMLRNWDKNQSQQGSEAFRGNGVRTEQDARISSLEREIRTLREERDIVDAAWQGPYSQGGANPHQVTARHGPDIQPWRYIGNDVLHA